MAAKQSSQGKSGEESRQIIARNRKARHEYEILETMEAGMVLVGSEVKSLRAGRCNLGDSYALVQGSEVWLQNLHIGPYEQAVRFSHAELRPRKLLLHKREIRKLIGKTAERGLTLVPLSLYFRDGKAKCELALARGKKLHDKRASKAEADVKRKLQQAMRGGKRAAGDE
jgi:SsrA-binding protein